MIARLSGLGSSPPKDCSAGGGGGRSGIFGGRCGICSLSISCSLTCDRCFFVSFPPDTLLWGADRSCDLLRRRKLKEGRRRRVPLDSARSGMEGSLAESEACRCCVCVEEAMPRNEWPRQVNVSCVSRKERSYGNVVNCLARGAEVMQSQAGYKTCCQQLL